MRKVFIGLLMFMTTTMNISAQDLNLPGPTSPTNVKVTDVGKVTQYIEQYVMTDSLTGKQDTVYQAVPEVVWQSEGVDIHQPARASRRAKATKMEGTLNDYFANVSFYIFKYSYTSINSQGEFVTLSGMAAVPDPDQTSEVKNLLIGTHITITADKERPSNQTGKLEASSDWSVLFAMASGNPTKFNASTKWMIAGLNAAAILSSFATWGITTTAVFSVEIAAATVMGIYGSGYGDSRYNFVVMPDYEGYGDSKDHAHPYLYQELTARQVIDGAKAALQAYQYDPQLKNVHLNFRKDWKTVICGYSQGGSVALATQRFMEQNHIDDEMRLVGSICGDGPYDPMSTLMYYVKRDLENQPMSMPVVLPLIVKGMLDSNPYMQAHKAEDYFSSKFIETGIMDWLANKEMTTGDIESAFKKLYTDGKDGNSAYYRDLFTKDGHAMMRNIMNLKCYDYFEDIYNNYKDKYKTAEGIPLPSGRGVMQDLHLALASNDVTDGWTPRHHILMFHSNVDTTVPYDNAERAEEKLGDWVVLHTADLKHDHGPSGKDFFAGDKNYEIVLSDNLRISQAIKKLIDLPSAGQTTNMIDNW